MHLVMLETNGNQRYIFESPRLRDAIGASYLLARLDQWAEEEFNNLSPTQPQSYEAACVSRSSGKVIVQVDGEEAASALISAVTRRVAAQAPGMDVTGVFVEVAGDTVCDVDVRRVHEAAARYAVSRPPAQARFAQLPFLVRGRDSALPASPRLATMLGRNLNDEANDDRTTELSLPRRVKRYYALDGREEFLEKMAQGAAEFGVKYENLRRDTNKLKEEIRLALKVQVEQMEHAFEGTDTQVLRTLDGTKSVKPLSRVAVIHIDGNGIGALMKGLQSRLEGLRDDPTQEALLTEKKISTSDADAFPSFVKEINSALEGALERACQRAYWMVARLQFPEASKVGLTSNDIVHVVPVLLGGDDVTVIANGDYAVPFTVEFLRAFESETANDPLLRAVSPQGKFTAGAGITIVPTKFPFHLAYDLAERLAAQAKRLGKDKGLSTFAYHQLVDTTILDPDALLEHYRSLSCQAFFIGEHGPVATSPQDRLGQSGTNHQRESQAAGETSEQEWTINVADPAPALASWQDMLVKTAVYAGVCKPDGTLDGTAFPSSRAHRMRGYSALIGAGLNDVEHGLSIAEAEKDTVLHDYVVKMRGGEQSESRKTGLTPEQLLTGEWDAASSQDSDYAETCRVIDHPHFFFDLINFKELVPIPYIKECAREWAGQHTPTDTRHAEEQGGAR